LRIDHRRRSKVCKPSGRVILPMAKMPMVSAAGRHRKPHHTATISMAKSACSAAESESGLQPFQHHNPNRPRSTLTRGVPAHELTSNSSDRCSPTLPSSRECVVSYAWSQGFTNLVKKSLATTYKDKVRLEPYCWYARRHGISPDAHAMAETHAASDLRRSRHLQDMFRSEPYLRGLE
jgi:hypothetical protein